MDYVKIYNIEVVRKTQTLRKLLDSGLCLVDDMLTGVTSLIKWNDKATQETHTLR